jgi:hypothetical protein
LQGFRLVYCLVGTDDERVRSLVRSSTNKLGALQRADPAVRAIELGQNQSITDRFLKLEVDGYTFISKTKLARMSPAP